MTQSSYIDLGGVIEFFERRGQSATADLFREPKKLSFSESFAEEDIVQRGSITWIPTRWMQNFFTLASASPSHAAESMRELQSEAIQWFPMEGDTVEGIQQSYERAKKIVG